MEGTGKEKAWGNWHNWFICPAKDCQANRGSKGSHGLKKPGILWNILGRLQTDFFFKVEQIFSAVCTAEKIDHKYFANALLPMIFLGNAMYFIYFVQRLKLKMFSWNAFCFWFLLFRHLGTNSLLAKVVERVRWSRTKSLLKKEQTNWHLSIFFPSIRVWPLNPFV